jgi:pimeloyl-ACP methyl ester carboxylesterase
MWVRGHRLEVAWHGPGPAEAPTLVLLHEGLGSIAAWREWPAELAAASGLGVLVYSRRGYGRSERRPPPWPLTYMHEEAQDILPAVLDATQVQRAVLVGHSDGGSIALIHASGAGPRIRGVVTMAAHVFCEDISVAAISAAGAAYSEGDLRARLAKYHEHVDDAFWGWNRAWLDPGFRAWNLEHFLPGITVPVCVIQGDADGFGTLAQVDAIVAGVRGPCSRVVLAGCGHAPWRSRAVETGAAVLELARLALASSAG